MDADLIALRIKVTGGKAGAGEVKLVRDEAGRLRDEQGRYVKEQTKSTKQQEENVKRQSRVTSAAFKKQAAMMTATGRTMTYGLTVPLGLAGVMAVKTAATFDKSMAQVKTATNLGGKGMKEMEALALKWGAETIFSANDSAEAMLELTKSGISPAQVKAGGLAATMSLAATEGLELGKTAEIVGATMNTFGLKASEAVRISDALAGGALASSASVGGLAQSLAQGGQGAAEMGLSVEETVGTLAAFAQNGIQASDAGTSFKTFLARLNPATKKAREEMAKYGLDFFDAKGHMLSITGVAQMLQTQLGGLSDEERGAAFNVIFGSDARRAANIVYKEGAAGLEKYISATEKSGTADRMAKAQMTGLAGALENLKGSMETAAVHLGHALAPAVEVFASAIGGLADEFSMLPPEVQTTIAVVGTLAALAGPVLWFAGSMAKAVIAIKELRIAEAAGGGGMLAGKGKWLRGLGIAGAGVLGAQAAGDAAGGDIGSWLSNVGSGAAIGAGVGSVVPVIGTGVGAAVGGTIGGVATAVDKLSNSERQLTYQQQRLADSSKSVEEWWGRQRAASAGLVAADQRVQGAHKRAHRATDAMRQAQRHLSAVVAEYGTRSRPAIHAEARLTGLVDRHRRAIKRLASAERLRGVALSAYKTATNITVLAERHRINVLERLRDRQARLYTASKQANPQSERTRNLASQLLGTEGKLADATKRHAQTLQDAASKGGRGYARFLSTANQESLRAGGQMKALNEKATALSETFRRLGEQRITLPTLPGTPAPLAPGPEMAGPKRPHGRNAAGTNFWRGGLTWLAERGPELVDLPRGAKVRSAPATRRLRGAAGDPQPSSAMSAYRAGGGDTRYLIAQPVMIGRKVVAEEVVEAEEDAKARL